jgi:hypothetical protein
VVLIQEISGTEQVAIAPHAAKGPEIMIERPILLHKKDDMFGVLDGTRPMVRGYRQCSLDALREGRSKRGAAQKTEECAAVGCHHRSHGLPELLRTPRPFRTGTISTALRVGAGLNEIFLKASPNKDRACPRDYGSATWYVRLGGPGRTAVLANWRAPGSNGRPRLERSGHGGSLAVDLRRRGHGFLQPVPVTVDGRQAPAAGGSQPELVADAADVGVKRA